MARTIGYASGPTKSNSAGIYNLNDHQAFVKSDEIVNNSDLIKGSIKFYGDSGHLSHSVPSPITKCTISYWTKATDIKINSIIFDNTPGFYEAFRHGSNEDLFYYGSHGTDEGKIIRHFIFL